MIIRRYLSGMFLRRFLSLLLGFGMLLQLIDLLDSASHVLGHHGKSHGGLATYLALRFPLVLAQVTPMSVLLAALMTYFNLAQRGEAVILRGGGIGPTQFLTLLSPAALAIGLVYGIVSDRVLPRSERALVDWWQDTQEDRDDSADGKPVWLRFGTQMLSADAVRDKGRHLVGLTVYPRDAQGRATGRMHAAEARWEAGTWTLHDVEAVGLEDDGHHVDRRDTLSWVDGPDPQNWWQLAVPQQHLALSQLRAILAGSWSGKRGPYYYEVAAQRVFVAPLTCLCMALLAMPGVVGSRRARTLGGGFMMGLGLGLGYILFDGIVGALGEAGVIAPVLAAWAPTGIFACLAIALYLRFEGA